MSNLLKKCSKCSILKTIDSFAKNIQSKDNLRPDCKNCFNKSQKQKYLLKSKPKISINYCCKYCGNLINRDTALSGKGGCIKCSNKGILNGNYKENILKYYCLDCNIQLSCKKTKRCYSCASKYKLLNRNQSGKNNPNWKNGLPSCIDCDKKLSNYHNKRCSSCAGKGKLNHNYKHGQGNSPYPLEFSYKLKHKMRERDNFSCQCCQISEEVHYTKNKEKLSVHHLDFNKFNCKHNNLLTVCRSCNTKLNFDNVLNDKLKKILCTRS